MLSTIAPKIQEKQTSSVTVTSIKATLVPVTNIVVSDAFYKFLEIFVLRNFSIYKEQVYFCS